MMSCLLTSGISVAKAFHIENRIRDDILLISEQKIFGFLFAFLSERKENGETYDEEVSAVET